MMEQHPIGAIYPPMTVDAFKELVEDIKLHGLIDPIIVYEDMVLDGWHRYRACQWAEKEPIFTQYEGDDPLGFVRSKNEIRRNLSKSQRGAAAAKALPYYEEQARKRQLATLKQNASTVPEKIPEREKGDARDAAAKDFDTNGRYVSEAKRLQQEDPELFEAVHKGEITIGYARRKSGKKAAKRRKKEKQEQVEQSPKLRPVLIVGDACRLTLPDESIDIIITSPPYNLGSDAWPMGGHGRQERPAGIGYFDEYDEFGYWTWQNTVLWALGRVAKKGASLFYNHKPRTRDGELIHPVSFLERNNGGWILRQEIVWDREVTHNHSGSLFWPISERVYWFTKGKPNLQEPIGMPDVWHFHGPQPNTWHPAPFPLELPRRCLEAVARPGMVVLDPFAGSCTTVKAALDFGCQGIGVDINADYLEQAKVEYGW